jgi:hypothetical protein
MMGAISIPAEKRRDTGEFLKKITELTITL